MSQVCLFIFFKQTDFKLLSEEEMRIHLFAEKDVTTTKR